MKKSFYKKYRKIISSLVFFFIASMLFIKRSSFFKNEVYAGETTYTSGTGTFNTPVGTTTLIIELWGGGGGGGAGPGNTNGAAGGGGGGGAYLIKTITSPGSSYSYSVGAGGSGGSVGNDGIPGDDTTFDGGTYTAGGGTEGGVGPLGTGGGGGTATGGDTNRDGGDGATGVTNQSGGGGGGAGTDNPGGNAGSPEVYSPGTGGSSLGGDGGTGCNTSSNCEGGSAPPTGYGGGGAGGVRNAAGGAGMDGYIRLTYYGVPTVTTQAVSDISYETATANGNITNTGDRDVTQRGFAYMEGSSGDPTIASSTVAENGTFSTGTYVGSLTGLSAGTDYRVRSFAVNQEGLSYGTTVGFTTLSYPSINISGAIYQSDGSTPYNCNTTNLDMNIVVNGSGTYPTTCTSSSGSWSVSSVSASSTDTVFVYIDGESPKANTVFVTDGTTQTDVNLIQDRVVLRDDVNGTITNSEISDGDTGDSDDLVSFSGSNITAGSSYTIHIYAGDTYAPGADVSTGKLLVIGDYSGSTETLTLTGSGTSTSRPLYINGGTFTSSSTVDYQGTSATTIENASYENLSFTPTITGATTYTFLSSGSVSGNLYIDPTASSSNTLTVNLGGTLTVDPVGKITLTGTTSGLSELDTTSGSSYTISAGKIDVQSAGTLTANASDIYLTGTSGTIFTRTGTFNDDTSEVFFQQNTGSTTLTSGEVTFNDMTLDMSGQTGSVGNNITVGGGLTVTAGELSIPATYTLSVTGNTDITGDLTISSSGSQTFTGTTDINSGGILTRSNASGTNTFTGKLTIDGGGTFTTSNNPAFILQGGLSNSGTFTSGTGTYTFNTNGQSLEGSAATTFNGDVAISGAITLQNSNTNTVTFGGDLTGSVAGSTYQNNTNATTDFKGAVLSTGTLTATANPNTIYYTSTSAQNIKDASYYNLYLTPTITGGITYTFLGASSVAGDMTINPTAASSNTLTVNLGGELTIADTGTLTITGTTSGLSLLDTVNGSNYSINAGDVTIASAGTLNGRASTITVAGDWDNSGTYTYNTSAVNFEGSGAQQILGSTTFYNVSITTSSPRTITFEAGGVTSVADNGSLTLEGQSENLLTLVSSVEDSDWYLQVSTTGTSHSVSYVDVSDSNASGFTQIDASDGTSTEGTGNINWLFPEPPPPDYKFGFESLEMTGVSIY